MKMTGFAYAMILIVSAGLVGAYFKLHGILWFLSALVLSVLVLSIIREKNYL
jgi:hypothetical protein